jgi:2-hydroxy-6-oxonona-2,4-dienedioate hydrolase
VAPVTSVSMAAHHTDRAAAARARRRYRAAVQSAWVTVDGLRAHFRRSPGGPPAGAPTVVLVHGVGVSHRYFEPTAHLLAPSARVLAPDLPGHGRTDRPPEPPAPGDLARWLGDFLDAVGVERAALLANSMGCQVAVELAVQRPALVTRMVLTGPTGDPRVRALPRWMWRLALDSAREPLRLDALVTAGYLRTGPLFLTRTFARAIAHPLDRQPAAVRAPALVVRGARDPICTADWAARLAGALADGRAAELRGAAHAVVYGWPGPLVSVAWPFLSAP